MNKDFSNRRLDRFGVIPYSFLEEFRSKDASTRRYLLNSMTLFASISPEQQHQILNDLIQSELMNLAEQSKKYLHQNVKVVLKRMFIEKPLSEKEIAEYYYKYYTITGVIPEEVTNEYLNILVNFILGIEMSKLLFLMSFVEQQRFFELQENYSAQVVLFYRYIKPIRSKLIKEKIVNRDIIGNYYYNRPWVNEHELLDYIFDLFDLDKIIYLGNCAKVFTFEKEYIYKAPDFE
ncbi:hypothetical protein [Microcoleus sp. FACHB-672]|uniref:hypothetical protein n=1 Tax=Microcoleus sp. FACHB-672 TaxID=2692825 RepID=UPI001F54D0AD|nr:hypothetical protein [Microcoleus sp. FACHB-672]